jgi:hypothetical protein
MLPFISLEKYLKVSLSYAFHDFMISFSISLLKVINNFISSTEAGVREKHTRGSQYFNAAMANAVRMET